MKKIAWTLEEACALLRHIEGNAKRFSCHVGLLGSVLHRGHSEHDLDIVIYPKNSTMHAFEHRAAEALRASGLKPVFNRDFVQKQWERAGSSDEKHVEVWETPDGRRVDVFFMR